VAKAQRVARRSVTPIVMSARISCKARRVRRLRLGLCTIRLLTLALAAHAESNPVGDSAEP
jgi:hypothetical protein